MDNWNIDKMNKRDKSNPSLKEQLFNMENNYAGWRSDVANCLCPNDPKVHEDFKAKIANLKNQIAPKRE